MSKDYVTKIESAYRIANTRVSLDSVVIDFLNGLSPESIVDNFSSLNLEQVFGAITFYLRIEMKLMPISKKVEQNSRHSD